MVPRVGFEPTSPRLRRGAVTRSAFSAELERPAGNDPASSRWQREALPLSYGRVVCGAGFEPAKDRAVGFTDRFRWPLGYPHAFGSREALSRALPVMSRAGPRACLQQVGGSVRVRTPYLIGIRAGFQDRLPATPADASVLVVARGLEPRASRFGTECSVRLSYATFCSMVGRDNAVGSGG